jgi:hypothetical protein
MIMCIVSRFKEVAVGTAITISVAGVKNPNTPVTSTFNLYTRNSGPYHIDAHMGITGVTLSGDPPVPGTLTFGTAKITPNNQNSNGWFEFKFGSPRSVLKGGFVEIGLPAGATFPGATQWTITGGITKIESIVLTSGKINI